MEKNLRASNELTPDSTSVPQPTLGADSSETCKVLLVRHGRSADIVPGSPESLDPPLHAEGVIQAVKVGERLSAAKISAVYSSHLERAHHTAREIARHHGLPVGIFEDLEEVRLGDWSHGEFRKRAASRDPQFLEWVATGRWDGIPNGEGDQAFRTRVSDRINEIASRHRGETVAVACHGGVINAYLAHILGTQRSLWMMVENTSITTVAVGPSNNGTNYNVLGLNDCSHLYDITAS